ncbi:MAG: hypothetical protein ACWA5W_08740 [Phycisphaerales bacterium]
MILKFLVMIVVCGSSGIGLLSVRQSRLQAAHEMAQARQESHRLEEQAGEIRAQIAQAYTPERVAAMLEQLGSLDAYIPAAQNPVQIDPANTISTIGSETAIGSEGDDLIDDRIAQSPIPDQLPEWGERDGQGEDSSQRGEPDEQGWVLQDGTRVIFVDD